MEKLKFEKSVLRLEFTSNDSYLLKKFKIIEKWLKEKIFSLF